MALPRNTAYISYPYAWGKAHLIVQESLPEPYYQASGRGWERGLTAIIRDHSNPKVIDKHFTAQLDAIKKSENLSIFSNAEVSVK